MSHNLRRSSRSSCRRLTSAPSSKPKLPTAPVSHKMPWVWWVAGGLTSLLIAAVPIVDWYGSNSVLAILALDLSDSGLADGKSVEDICRVHTKALKAGDQAIDLGFADTTEPTFVKLVNSPTRLFSRCKSYINSLNPCYT